MKVLLFLFILISAGFKAYFWYRIPNVGIGTLVRSFFKRFNVYAVFEAPNPAYQKFRSASNVLNLVFWVSIILLVVLYLFPEINLDKIKVLF